MFRVTVIIGFLGEINHVFQGGWHLIGLIADKGETASGIGYQSNYKELAKSMS